jgi:hypothetical protein
MRPVRRFRSSRYACDKDGRIIEAVQYMGRDCEPVSSALRAAAAAAREPVEGPIEALDPGAEQFRVKFAYL